MEAWEKVAFWEKPETSHAADVKAQDDRELNQVANRMRKSILKTKTIKHALMDIDNVVLTVLESLQSLGQARAQLISDINLHIAAGEELLQRVRETMLPEAEKKYAKLKSANAGGKAESLKRFVVNFEQTIEDMRTGQLQSQTSVLILGRTLDTLADLKNKVDYHLEFNVPKWEAQAREMGVQLMSYEVTKLQDEEREHIETLMARQAKYAELLSQGSGNQELLQKMMDEVTAEIEATLNRGGELDSHQETLMDKSLDLQTTVLDLTQRGMAAQYKALEARQEQQRLALGDASRLKEKFKAEASGDVPEPPPVNDRKKPKKSYSKRHPF